MIGDCKRGGGAWIEVLFALLDAVADEACAAQGTVDVDRRLTSVMPYSESTTTRRPLAFGFVDEPTAQRVDAAELVGNLDPVRPAALELVVEVREIDEVSVGWCSDSMRLAQSAIQRE